MITDMTKMLYHILENCNRISSNANAESIIVSVAVDVNSITMIKVANARMIYLILQNYQKQ